MNGEVGWSSLEIRFKNTKNPICIYLLWRSNDFNAMFVTVEDMETGHTKKYKYMKCYNKVVTEVANKI